MDWIEVRDQEGIAALLKRYGGFHDSCIVGLSYKSGAYVDKALAMEAQSEARFLMLSANNILKPQDGKPVVSPTQDMSRRNFTSKFKCEAACLGVQLRVGRGEHLRSNWHARETAV